ncbi:MULTISPECIES: hypothetical protein [unclassified Bacillus (in: firmicutes)]|nr:MULTISPECIES: hypothetical protein [unclassified Bacillus (in: firmicutes)]
MLRKNIDQGWDFINGKPSMIPGYGQQGKTVNLPHDHRDGYQSGCT